MPDVNVLIYAFGKATPNHRRYSDWLEELVNAEEPFALSEIVLQGFIRVATNPRIGASAGEAFAFAEKLRSHPHSRIMRPGPGHWAIFKQLCVIPGIRGRIVADAAHAALAIEHGCEWITSDTDFARFSPPLRWRLL
jgi:uncharacterized protein